MSSTFLHPDRAQFEALASLETDGPVVMLNLLRFKPDGGREAYAKYAAAAGPFLTKVGASLRFRADARATVIGDEEWDEMILVEYPSKQAFFEMSGDPDYPSALRAAALEDSRLVLTTEPT